MKGADAFEDIFHTEKRANLLVEPVIAVKSPSDVLAVGPLHLKVDRQGLPLPVQDTRQGIPGRQAVTAVLEGDSHPPKRDIPDLKNPLLGLEYQKSEGIAGEDPFDKASLPSLECVNGVTHNYRIPEYPVRGANRPILAKKASFLAWGGIPYFFANVFLANAEKSPMGIFTTTNKGDNNMRHPKMTTSWRRLLATILIMLFASSTASCRGGGGDQTIGVEGLKMPEVEYDSEFIYITAVFENLEIMGGLRYAVPKYPNSYLELGPDFESDGALLSIAISLQDLGSGSLTKLDPQTLPGGRPIPGIRGGKLPSVAFSIEELNNIHIYAGNSFLGVFLPMDSIDIQYLILTYRFHLKNGTRAGNISIIGQDHNGENSGALLLLKLKKEVFEQASSSPVQNHFNNTFGGQAQCNPTEGDCNSNV